MSLLISKRQPMRDRADEAKAAVAHLETQLRSRLRNIRVIAEPDGVVIRGVANSYHVKQLAQHAIMRKFALPVVANEITVPSADRHDDGWMSLTKSANTNGVHRLRK
jgi:hypothetical protein